MRKTLTCVILFALSSAASLAVQGPDPDPGVAGEDPSHGRGHAETGGRGFDHARKPHEDRLPGRLIETDEGVKGRYVDFTTPRNRAPDGPEAVRPGAEAPDDPVVLAPEASEADECAVRDHRAAGVVFFSLVRLEGPCIESRIEGARYLLQSAGGRLRAHDAPTGLLNFRLAPDAWLRFHLAPGTQVRSAGFGLFVSHEGTGARLVTDPEHIATTDDGFIVRGSSGNFLAESPRSLLLARPEVVAAVEAGSVAANIDLLSEDGIPAVQAMALDDVDVHAVEADGALRVVVSSDLPSGRSFTLHLPDSAYDAERLRFEYFDVDETLQAVRVPAPRVDLVDALEVDEGEGPEYAAVGEPGWVHVIVAVPHFSTHLFEISSWAKIHGPNLFGGLLLGALACTEAGLIMFMGRRTRREPLSPSVTAAP